MKALWIRRCLWRRALALAVAVVLLSAGCVRTGPLTTPVPVERYDGTGEGVVVLLPGIRDRAASFERHGFVEAARERGVDATFVAADLHFGYYRARTAVERLREDVVREQAGPVWLVGVSLGGLGALLFAREHPEDVAGVVLIAPFLGEDPLVEAIADAGGPRRWAASSDIEAEDAAFAELWRWLADRESDAPPIWLAFGASDQLAPAAEQLATLLPPERVLRGPGGHDWDTWSELWDRLLESGVVAAGAPHGRASAPISVGKR